MEKEFFSLAETEGIADIEELNKILDRAVTLKNFLKAKTRMWEVARFVADHYKSNVEPLGYKAFLVAVDREACADYKELLDQFLPAEYSEVVYTGNNNDSPKLKKFHLDEKKERGIRKSFIPVWRVPQDPHCHREAADRFRRADPLRDVSRQAHARPHALTGDSAG